MNLYRIASLLLFLMLAPAYRAQGDSSLYLSRQQWQEMTDGVDYTENFDQPEKKSDKPAKSNIPSTGRGFDLGALKYVFYVVVFAIVVFLVVLIFGNFKKNASVKEQVVSLDAIHEIEENLHEVNLEDLLQKALQAKNYRIALRLNFLIIIKLLSQKGLISWAKEKTNWEYYAELPDKLMADKFKELIISFETFWYGEHPLTESQYQLAEPSYQALQKQLTPDA